MHTYFIGNEILFQEVFHTNQLMSTVMINDILDELHYIIKKRHKIILKMYITRKAKSYSFVTDISLRPPSDLLEEPGSSLFAELTS